MSCKRPTFSSLAKAQLHQTSYFISLFYFLIYFYYFIFFTTPKIPPFSIFFPPSPSVPIVYSPPLPPPSFFYIFYITKIAKYLTADNRDRLQPLDRTSLLSMTRIATDPTVLVTVRRQGPLQLQSAISHAIDPTVLVTVRH